MTDVIVVSEHRRTWPDELKKKILSETLLSGGNVLSVARTYDIDPAQIYQWRKKFRVEDASAVKLTPVELVSYDLPPVAQAKPVPSPERRLEIACKSGHTLFW